MLLPVHANFQEWNAPGKNVHDRALNARSDGCLVQPVTSFFLRFLLLSSVVFHTALNSLAPFFSLFSLKPLQSDNTLLANFIFGKKAIKVQ